MHKNRPTHLRQEGEIIAFEKMLTNSGMLGLQIRSFNWVKSVLGPFVNWSSSLRHTVSLCLKSRFPCIMYWGPKFIVFYNDAFVPILGEKHPNALGNPGYKCWPEIWHIIGPMLESVLKTGQSTWSDDLLLVINRKGFLEESYMTFSYTPVLLETGDVGGSFTAVNFTTDRVIGERRLRTIRDLASATADGKSPQQVCQNAEAILKANREDIPFFAVYLLDTEQKAVRVCSGAYPERLDFPFTQETKSGNPLEVSFQRALTNVLRFAKTEVADIQSIPDIPLTPWNESPHTSILLPLTSLNGQEAIGVFVAAVSPRRELDENYQTFFETIAQRLSATIASATAFETEKKRAEALAALDRAKTEFFSNISHEFRTPLTLMLGPIEDALSSPRYRVGNSEREWVELVHRNTIRLLKLVNTLLDFSRIEAGRIQASYEPVNLADLTRDLASNFRSATERAGLELVIDCPPLPEPIYVDRSMWEKVILNLISNAFKYTFRGEIRVSLSWEDDKAQLEISDTGTGIPETELSKIFDRFYRVKGAVGRSFEGTGIGLALVKELVRLHGGDVFVTSHPGKGTKFTVVIPAGVAHLPSDQVVSSAEEQSDSKAMMSAVTEAERWVAEKSPAESPLAESSTFIPRTTENQEKYQPQILVADDNSDMRDYVKRLLGQYWRVRTVADGAEALAVAQETLPDLIVSDVMMPSLNGFELLREILLDPRTKDIPVILLSARAGQEARIEGLDAGAHEYLVKPFSAKELISRVNSCLERSKETRRTLRKKAVELESANEELKRFAYAASHDLKEPLRMVSNFVSLLAKRYQGKFDKDADLYIRFAAEGASRMHQLVDDILTFSKLGLVPREKVACDMNRLVSEVLADLQLLITETHAVINVEPLPVVTADRGQIRHVFSNLISNAIHYRGPDRAPEIVVTAKKTEGEYVFSVRDNGIGIENQYFDKIFSLFQRLNSREVHSGSGVGLAICKKVIENHGGKIQVESNPGVGSMFNFSLPQRSLNEISR